MPGLLWRWLDDATLAATTRATYTVYVRKLEQILIEFEHHELTARDITALMYHERKRLAIVVARRHLPSLRELHYPDRAVLTYCRQAAIVTNDVGNPYHPRWVNAGAQKQQGAPSWSW